MNTTTYDRIIERYLDGALSPVEEHEFRTLLEIDSDVRSLFDAELAVRATFAEDAEAIPVETERSYARFLAALAATSPAATGESGAAASTTPKGSGGWLPAGVARLAGAIVVTLGLAGTGYVLWSSDDGIEAVRKAAPASVTTSRSAIERPSTNANGATAGTGGMKTNEPGATTTSTDAVARIAEPKPAPNRERTTSAAQPTRLDGVTTPETKALVDPHDDLTEIDQRSGNVDDLPVIESDSVGTRVSFKNRTR